MTTIRTAALGGAGMQSTVFAMAVSRGSGDLLVTVGGTYAGSLPESVDTTLEEGPTVSGPWVPVPGVGTVTTGSGVNEETVGQQLLNFSWSMPFLRVTFIAANSDQYAVVQIITPAGTILK